MKNQKVILAFTGNAGKLENKCELYYLKWVEGPSGVLLKTYICLTN